MANISKVFVGWDSREDDAYLVCENSILRRSSKPVQVTPLIQKNLRESGLYRRTWHFDEVPVPNSPTLKKAMIDDQDGRVFATEFSFSRFLVPALMDYKGWALFVDLDFLYMDDIQKLFAMADDRYAVMCVHHNHVPTEDLKMDGVPQSKYLRKNWSSMVLWNCGHEANRALTVDKVNTESGGWLHRFSWLKDDLIGAVPEEWNWLEGHSSLSIKPKAVHYTRGGPWFENYQDVHFAKEWLDEFELVKAKKKGNPRSASHDSAKFI